LLEVDDREDTALYQERLLGKDNNTSAKDNFTRSPALDSSIWYPPQEIIVSFFDMIQ
jgi:hypothetical protein